MQFQLINLHFVLRQQLAPLVQSTCFSSELNAKQHVVQINVFQNVPLITSNKNIQQDHNKRELSPTPGAHPPSDGAGRNCRRWVTPAFCVYPPSDWNSVEDHLIFLALFKQVSFVAWTYFTRTSIPLNHWYILSLCSNYRLSLID